ncbi:MAG: hypothetical protein WD135_08325 [Ferruginibacter sp.]
MKKIIFAFLVCIAFISFKHFVNQPLENTRWKGTINAPSPIEAVFEFKKDSFFLYVDGQVFETMYYRVNGDSLSIVKLDGTSPCNAEEAVYNFSIKENKLYLKVTNDPCSIRASAFNEYYTKE